MRGRMKETEGQRLKNNNYNSEFITGKYLWNYNQMRAIFIAFSDY